MCKETAQQCAYCESPAHNVTRDGFPVCMLHDAGCNAIHQIETCRGYMFDLMGQNGINFADVMSLTDQILLVCEEVDG